MYFNKKSLDLWKKFAKKKLMGNLHNSIKSLTLNP